MYLFKDYIKFSSRTKATWFRPEIHVGDLTMTGGQ